MRLHCFFFPLLCAVSSLQAQDLRQVYELAVYEDPTLKAACASLQANRQALPEAISVMVPNLSASYSTTGNKTTTSTYNPFVYQGNYNTQNYGITLTQPLFHPEHWAQLEQARHIVKEATATYFSATQALIIRVAEQYFNILGAIDDLDFTRGQLKAFSREYEQAKQRFEVGLIAVTDVETAKARYDTGVSEELSAQNALFDQYEKLREITGLPIEQVTIFPVKNHLPLLPPSPSAPEMWVNTAHQQNFDVIAARERARQFKAAIGTQVSGHYPKFDISGSLQRTVTPPPFNDLSYDRSVTLNISIPLFAGGNVVFHTIEAQARYDEAMQQLEARQRAIDSATRQAYRGILTAMSSVQALAQAVISNESSLNATKAAYSVGTRTIVDVLNAESSLLNAQRDHAKARYNYLLEGLKLKQAAGILAPEDLFMINELITQRKGF